MLLWSYLDFCISNSLEQIMMPPTTPNGRRATFVDHALTNSSHKISQWGVMDLGLSNHYLILCIQKTVWSKFHKNHQVL